MSDSEPSRLVPAQQFFDDPSHYLHGNAVILLRRALVRELLGELADTRIIDVGCGDGSLSLQYAESGSHITLIDFSETMLAAARNNIAAESAGRVTVQRADITAAEPLTNSPADVVLCVGVLAHVPRPEATVAKVASLVKPGGRLLLQISDYDRPVGKLLYWFARAVTRSRRYPLARIGSSDVVSWAGRSGLSLVAESVYPASPPGYRLLPMELQRKALQVMHSQPLLAPVRTEALLLFERAA